MFIASGHLAPEPFPSLDYNLAVDPGLFIMELSVPSSVARAGAGRTGAPPMKVSAAVQRSPSQNWSSQLCFMESFLICLLG